jgi:integrase
VWLPSGSARVKVYGGIDPVTKRPLWLRETLKPRRTKRETEREADKVLTRLLNPGRRAPEPTYKRDGEPAA